MHPPLTLDVVGEEGDVAVSPPTLTLLARVERLEEQICQLAALDDKQYSPPGVQISAGSSEPSTPSSVERRRKPAMEVLGDTVVKGTVLERVANLEHLQASISRDRSPNGKSPAKAARALFAPASASPVSEPKEGILDKAAEPAYLPEEEASKAANGHATDNGKLPLERELAASDQAGEAALSESSGLGTKQERSESAGLDTRMTPLTPAQDAEPAGEPAVSLEGVNNSTVAHESKSPPPQEEEEKLEQVNNQVDNHLDSSKEPKHSKGKPWKRLQNYIKKKMHSMSSSKSTSKPW